MSKKLEVPRQIAASPEQEYAADFGVTHMGERRDAAPVPGEGNAGPVVGYLRRGTNTACVGYLRARFQRPTN